MSDMNIYPIEYLEWMDSTGPDGWNKPDIDKIDEYLPIISVGWLTNETKISVTIVCHIQVKGNCHYAEMTIPKCAITKRDRL